MPLTATFVPFIVSISIIAAVLVNSMKTIKILIFGYILTVKEKLSNALLYHLVVDDIEHNKEFEELDKKLFTNVNC